MFKSSFLLVYDLTLHDFGQIRLYMTWVKSDFTWLGSNQTLHDFGQIRLYMTLVKSDFTWLWSNQTLHAFGQIRLYMTLVQSDFTCLWSNQTLHDFGQIRLYMTLVKSDFTWLWSNQTTWLWSKQNLGRALLANGNDLPKYLNELSLSLNSSTPVQGSDLLIKFSRVKFIWRYINYPNVSTS